MALLLVIDMQDQFLDGQFRALSRRIVNLIKVCKSRNDDILFLEYGNRYTNKPSKPTIKMLLNAVKGYEKFSSATKYDDCGAKEVMEVVKNYKLEDEEIIVCGVNTSCCVRDTVYYLGQVKGYNRTMIIIDDCCANVFDSKSAKQVFENERSLDNNVTIVSNVDEVLSVKI